MAPPPSRRPGFSRRAQYGLFIGYVVAIAGVMIGVAVILVAALDPSGFSLLRGAALDVTAPVSATARAGLRGGGDAIGRVGDWWRAGEHNRVLRQELDLARRRLIEARIVGAENVRLRRLARLSDAAPERVAAVRIVASSAGDTRRMATITAGRLAGVVPGMPVRAAEGLVGRVIDAGQIAARVQLLTDGGSIVPVRRLADGSAALAAGRGDGLIELRPLSAGANPFRPGDMVVTSGTGGVFPPNVPTAIVVERREDVALARPLADPATLDFAIVERAYVAPAPPPAAIAPPPAP
jgi:rod shape-determining protein MreC